MTSSIKAPSALHKFVAVMADGINPTYPTLSKVGTCEKQNNRDQFLKLKSFHFVPSVYLYRGYLDGCLVWGCYD